MHPGSLLFATVICPSHFLAVSPYSIDLMSHSTQCEGKQRREEVSKLTGLYAPAETVRHSRRGQHTLPRPTDLTRVAPQPAEVSPGQ